MTPQDAVKKLEVSFPGIITDQTEFRGEVSVFVAAGKIAEVCRFLKNNCTFDMLTDLSGIDNFGEEPRFRVDYLLYSFTHRVRLRLKVSVAQENPVVDTVTTVWKTADWHEREAFDMYGIKFAGHPNLKRILMWEGYPYHPLRKDFPLAGLPADLPQNAQDAGRAETAPMLGGPFVAATGTNRTISREPRQYDTGAEFLEKQKSPVKKEQV